MSDASQFKVYLQDEATVNLRIVDELVRLLEIRVEELENIIPKTKDAPNVIDDREISVLVNGKWGESK